MYSNNFVVAILHNGQFCDDKNGIVSLPFGAEYKQRLRNKNNRRAVATVYVDNENVSKGGIVVNANNYLDLEGPVDSHANFKFVSSSSGEAIDQGKNDVKDGSNGLIRVEWRLEKPAPKPVFVKPRTYRPWSNPDYVQPSWPYPVAYEYPATKRLTSRGAGPCGQSMTGIEESLNFCDFSPQPAVATQEGCTVPGSYSNQTWSTIHLDLEDTVTTIQLTLRGFYPKQVKPKTNFCDNCGSRPGKSNAKFCYNCGGRLG